MSLTISRSVEIQAQRERVWAELIDWKAMAQWFVLVREVQSIEPDGDRVRRRLTTYLGLTFIETIDQFDPHRRLAWFVENSPPGVRSSRANASLTTSPGEGETTITWTVEIEFRNAALEALLGRGLVRPVLGSILGHSLRRLRARVEAAA